MTSYDEIQLTLTVLGLVGSAVWVVSSIKSTTNHLSECIEGLKNSIKDLTDSLSKVHSDLRNHEDRLRRLETK